jgi:hypothetical protein
LKEEAATKAESALEEGDIEEAARQSKRNLFVSKTER